MSDEGSKPENAKEARLKRIQEQPKEKRPSIGNFSQTYSIRGRALSDDEETKPVSDVESASASKSYSFQFDKGDKDGEQLKGIDDGHFDRTLYAKLTESVREQLDSVDEHLERVKNGTSSLQELASFIDTITIRQSAPVLEFDDIDSLQNFNLLLVRCSPGNKPVSTEAGNFVVFNNQTSLVSLEIAVSDPEKNEQGVILASSQTTHVIRTLLKAGHDDIFTFVSAAQSPYNNCVLTAKAADNTILFVDVSQNEVLFKVPLHNSETVRTVIAAGARGTYLAVAFDDFGVQVYDIQSGTQLKEYVLSGTSSTYDFIQTVTFLQDSAFRVTSNQAIFMMDIGQPNTDVQRHVFEMPETQMTDKKEASTQTEQVLRVLHFAAQGFHIYGAYGSNSVHMVAITDASQPAASASSLILEPGQKLLDITSVNEDSSEFALLVEIQPERPKAMSVHAPLVSQKIMIMAAIRQESIVAVDSFRTFEEAVSLYGLSTRQHVVLEGNQTFAVYCVNDKHLHTQIKEGLLQAVTSGSADTRQISTKEDSNSSSRRQSRSMPRANRGLGLKVDQPPLSPLVSGFQGLSGEELSKLIKEQVSQMKETLRAEILGEIKANLKSYIEEQVKAAVAEELEKIKQPQSA